ncbi:hypothetical protein PoB_002696300 [Plakobranchus ocellatus]|uniref:Uncharacterized protein n=1 Tax=Plakobranchus ocellatus TaxID=259542 RepID=A0AAV3ZZZ5_9GAST|nr:hypothetical protein PoB_002696300 [Plakobranchus ocellatus]
MKYGLSKALRSGDVSIPLQLSPPDNSAEDVMGSSGSVDSALYIIDHYLRDLWLSVQHRPSPDAPHASVAEGLTILQRCLVCSSLIHRRDTRLVLEIQAAEARGSESSARRKEEILDQLERNFCDYVKNYVSDVKEGIRAASPETADELFHSAVAFFSQDLPEPTCQARDGQKKDGEGDIGEEMSALKDKVNALEKRVQENKIEGQKNCSFLELQIDISADSMRNDFQNLNRKLESLKNQVKALELETKKSMKDAAATTPSAAVVTSPPTGASATELSRPLKKVKLWTDFSAKVASDRHHPEITDVQLLPCGTFLLADYTNRRVKLFETQGQHLHTMECRSNPRCLALLDSSGTSNSYTAALTLPHCPSIDILEVADNNIKVKVSYSIPYIVTSTVNILKLTDLIQINTVNTISLFEL